MLDGGGDDAVAAPLLGSGNAKDGDVVRLGATGGKIDFGALASQRGSNLSACQLQLFLCLKALAVQRGWISIAAGQHFIYSFGGFLSGSGRRTVVIIDFVRQKSTLPFFCKSNGVLLPFCGEPICSLPPECGQRRIYCFIILHSAASFKCRSPFSADFSSVPAIFLLCRKILQIPGQKHLCFRRNIRYNEGGQSNRCHTEKTFYPHFSKDHER